MLLHNNKTVRARVVLLLCLFSLVGSGVVPGRHDGVAGDWPRWRGPTADGVSTEADWSTNWPAEGPKRLWEASVGVGFSSVTVADGKAYTLGNWDKATDTVLCLDAVSGKEIWKHSYPCPIDARYYEGGPGSSPTIDTDHARVYTLSKRGLLVCFESRSGKVLWQKDLATGLGVTKPQWGYAGSPVVTGDRILLNLGGAGTALSRETGEVLWTSSRDASGYATPMLASLGNEPAALIFAAKALVAVKIKDGAEIWRYPWTTRWDINAADPILKGKEVFLSSFDRGGAVLDISGAEPRVRWASKNLSNHFSPCVSYEGYLYGIDGNTDIEHKDLRCVAWDSGEVKWTFNGVGMGSLILAGNRLVVMGDKGELLVAPATPAGFNPSARAQVMGGKCWTAPTLANGKLYCRNAAGTVICLELPR